MSQTAANKEVVRRAIAAFNEQNLEVYLSYHTSDYTSHEVFYPKPLTYDEVCRFIPQYWHSYPDAYVDTQHIWAEGDTVVVENIMSGTFMNDFEDSKATQKSFKIREACVFVLQNGKISAARVYTDRKAINEQLGVA